MQVTLTSRGFEVLDHQKYPDGGPERLAQQSSIIGDYDDSMDRPGSSSLWIGEHHHLDRKEVMLFIAHLESWVKTGSLKITENQETLRTRLNSELSSAVNTYRRIGSNDSPFFSDEESEQFHEARAKLVEFAIACIESNYSANPNSSNENGWGE